MESFTDIDKKNVLSIFNYNLEDGEYRFKSFDDLLLKGKELNQKEQLELKQHINYIVNHFKTYSISNKISFFDKYHATDSFIKDFRVDIKRKSELNGGGKKRPRSIKRGKPKKDTSKKKKRTNRKR